MIKVNAACGVAALVLALTPWDSGAIRAVDGRDLDTIFANDVLVIEASRECLFFNIYLADEPWQKARGLMFVKALPQDWGMLFRYPAERHISMYMKNTLISLDMLFIAKGGNIIHIAARTTPGSLESIYPEAPALAVLEINGGLSEQLGVTPGQRVLYPPL